MRKSSMKSDGGEPPRGLFRGCCWSGSGLAVFLSILGGFFLARDFNLIPANLSFWYAALILLGAFLPVNNRKKMLILGLCRKLILPDGR